MTAKITRRQFIGGCAGAAGLLGMSMIAPGGEIFGAEGGAAAPALAVVSKGQPGKLVRKAVELLGGMSKFVSKGDVVVVKPNIGWDRKPEQAATTNPWVVAAVVRMCLEAGAGKVRVFDRPCNTASRCYASSGIEKAAKEAGALVSFMAGSGFSKMSFPEGKVLKSWKMYRQAIEADLLINVPIAKHHGITGVTLGMKNLMGIMGGDRGAVHVNIARKLGDVAKFVRPRLTILDAVRILTDDGPQGGDAGDVKQLSTVIAGTDIAAVDAYGVTLFGLDPLEEKFLTNARELGLGEIDLAKIDIKKVSL